MSTWRLVRWPVLLIGVPLLLWQSWWALVGVATSVVVAVLPFVLTLAGVR